MSFTPNVPNTGQSLGETKNPIRNNFSILRNTIAENHYDVNNPNFGKHGTLIMPVVGNSDFPNPPTTLALEGALYTKEEPPSSGETQLYYRRESNGIQTGMAFLSGSVIVAGPSLGITLKDFTGSPNCYGIFEARVNTTINEVRCMQMIYVISGTYNDYYFVNGSGALQINTGTGSADTGFVGPLMIIGMGAGITYPCTVSWTFSGYYFST